MPRTAAGRQRTLLSSQELEFLQLACSDMTYKEIARNMGLNPRSVDSLRDQLFVKLDVKSRVNYLRIAVHNHSIPSSSPEALPSANAQQLCT